MLKPERNRVSASINQVVADIAIKLLSLREDVFDTFIVDFFLPHVAAKLSEKRNADALRCSEARVGAHTSHATREAGERLHQSGCRLFLAAIIIASIFRSVFPKIPNKLLLAAVESARCI